MNALPVVTIDGTTGPGLDVNKALNNVSKVEFDFINQVATVFYDNDGQGPAVATISLNHLNAVTATITNDVISAMLIQND